DLEIIEEERLVENAATVGDHLLMRLRELEAQHSFVTAARGRGLMCAFDLPGTAMRDAVRKRCFDTGILILGCGRHSLRFRPPLTITNEEIDAGLEVLVDAMSHVHRHGPDA
ncbi:MAG: aminotransferase class III-fold pyridoxal phosphate-dependent enzyme, partial [Rhodothermales bacterium]|nr:aminotransferase class III-fold pyridoxal phosphate-dependent enzyme [Rhodothermales bacterium]